ncbi:MAG TPA: hypothetical protein VGI14_23005 [Casimicrobiaceae bacterium]|jgi:hypothetical protein
MNEAHNPGVELSSFLATNQLYFEAFAERDANRRGELLARCMTEDAEIWGPNRLFAGYTAISEKIAAFHRNWPGCRLVLASGIVSFEHFVRFAVAIVRADSTVVATGENIDELAADGRIRRVVPLWAMALPPLPNSWPEELATRINREPPNAA